MRVVVVVVIVVVVRIDVFAQIVFEHVTIRHGMETQQKKELKTTMALATINQNNTHKKRCCYSPISVYEPVVAQKSLAAAARACSARC